jgi:hypothetical protein
MDIRMVRGRESRAWLWVTVLALASALLLVAAAVFGDSTMSQKRKVGALAGFGGDRAPVLPMETQRFESLLPLDTRELGRLVHLTATAESRQRNHAVWVRTPGGRRILVRFEPEPPAGALRALGPGSRLEVNGYLQRVSRAEFDMWMDTLGVRIPRPRPGAKFGDVPDSGFAKIDSLFIKDFYVSVRPEGLRGVRSTTELRPDTSLATPTFPAVPGDSGAAIGPAAAPAGRPAGGAAGRTPAATAPITAPGDTAGGADG